MARGKSKKRGTPIWRRIHVDGATLWRASRTVSWVALVAAAILGWMLGVPKLEAYAAASGPGVGDIPRVQLLNKPIWLREDLETSLILTAEQIVTGDPLAQHELAATRDALFQTGWFESIASVRRVRRDLVVIDGKFVRPYALIRYGNADHLVDDSGGLLPWSIPVGTSPHFLVITGCRFGRPTNAGDAWPGADVTAALRLLRLIDQQPWRHQVRAIDVSDYLTRQSLALISTRRARIVWGRPPGDEAGIEETVQTKLGYLHKQFTTFNHIDGGYATLDITGPYARASGTAPEM